MPNDSALTGVTSTESPETATQTQVETQASPQTAAGPIELNDDALVTWNGAKEPVKFSNLRGLQSQFTKVSQTKAKLERQYQEAVERNKTLEAAIQRAQQSGRSQQQPSDPFAKIRELPYLTGAEAADTVSAITAELGRRDQILQLMAHKIVELQDGYSNLNRNHSTQSFEKKLSGWVDSLGLDPDYVEDARIFYLAHEWEDDSEFPELYKAHLEKRSGLEQRKTAARREAARKQPFVPGKGGLSATTGEANFAGKSPKEQADELWPLLEKAMGT
jgi:hypothetical protein